MIAGIRPPYTKPPTHEELLAKIDALRAEVERLGKENEGLRGAVDEMGQQLFVAGRLPLCPLCMGNYGLVEAGSMEWIHVGDCPMIARAALEAGKPREEEE